MADKVNFQNSVQPPSWIFGNREFHHIGSAIPSNPTLEPNIMSILYTTGVMLVYVHPAAGPAEGAYSAPTDS